MITDHHDKYNHENIWNTVRIIQMWCRHTASKYCWKNDAHRPTQCRVAMNLPFIKNTLSGRHIKAKYTKTRSAWREVISSLGSQMRGWCSEVTYCPQNMKTLGALTGRTCDGQEFTSLSLILVWTPGKAQPLTFVIANIYGMSTLSWMLSRKVSFDPCNHSVVCCPIRKLRFREQSDFPKDTRSMNDTRDTQPRPIWLQSLSVAASGYVTAWQAGTWGARSHVNVLFPILGSRWLCS